MAHSKPVRVVIVDDHPGIRQGLRAMLELCGDYALCGEAESAAQALDIIASEKPDVAIVDISLKGSMHGLELTRQLKSLHPEVSVLGPLAARRGGIRRWRHRCGSQWLLEQE
jgi:DNA-binding NarL/FixJ family response regulator